jgi:hypothetical protein
MAGQTLRIEKNTATKEHASVSRSTKQSYGSHEKAHAYGHSIWHRPPAGHRFHTKGHEDDSDCQGKQKSNPIQDSRVSVSAPASHPSRTYQVEGENAAKNISRLRFHYREVRPRCGHAQHRRDEYVSSHAMAAGTLAKRHCRGARQQPYNSAANVKQ